VSRDFQLVAWFIDVTSLQRPKATTDNYMGRSSGEAACRSAVHTPHHLWNPKFHYRFHKTPPLAPIRNVPKISSVMALVEK